MVSGDSIKKKKNDSHPSLCYCIIYFPLCIQVKDTADSRLQAGMTAGMTASPEAQKRLTGIMSKVRS